MHIPDLDSGLLEIAGQIFRHFFGEGGDQHPFLPGGHLVDFADQIVNLPLDGTNFRLGIQQSGGPDDLLHNLPGATALVVGGSGGDVDHLVQLSLKLLKIQRPVVKSGWQTEAKVDQALLSGVIPGVHGSHLGNGDMAFVNEHEEILWEVVQEGGGRRPGGPPGNDPGVVFDAGAEADFSHHLQVIIGALGNPLGFQQLIFLAEPRHLLVTLPANFLHGPGHFFLGGHVVAGGIDGHVFKEAFWHAGDGVDFRDPVNFIAEEFHPNGAAIPVGGVNLQGVPPKAELIPGKVQVVALVANFSELSEEAV